ncbi:peptide deformylase [Candidatus Uhrbacteria bacterium]|nr:peptide deformylase [Candidatus Uhrbacteria bacterium]
MAIRPIVRDGDPVLRIRAKEVDPKDLGGTEFAQLIEDMLETMYVAKGVGIAAPQIGVSLRVFIAESPDGPIALVNPVFSRPSKKTLKDQEGCLSVPGHFDTVSRYKGLAVEALTAEGKPVRFSVDGFFARILQHEMDHLDGMLFIDRVKEQKARKV